MYLSPQQQAADETTPPNRLFELARTSTNLARLVALNPSAPPELLQELSASSDATTLENVSANPNTPTEVLLKLGAQFPEQLLNNPMFSLLLLENPNLADAIPLATLQSLVKYENVPVSILERAVEELDLQVQEVQLALAMNAQTPKAVLKKLIQSGYEQVVDAAWLHVNWAGEISKGWEEVALKAVTTATLKRNNEEHLREFAAIGLIPEFVINSLDRNYAVLEKVAQHPSTSESILEKFAQDNNVRLRETVASNPNTPERILEELAKDEIPSVLNAVAGNANTPERILAHLANDVRFRARIARNPNTSEALLENLAKDSKNYDWEIRMALAHNPKASREILEQLIGDEQQIPKHLAQEYRLLRWAVAVHPNTSTTIREQLFGDNFLMPGATNFPLFCYIAKNPYTPGKALEQLAGLSPILQGIVAQNLNTPEGVLEKLVGQNPIPQEAINLKLTLQGIVAQNPNTPKGVLEKLVGQNPMLQETIAQNPNIPKSLLEQWAKDKYARVYKAAMKSYLALNPERLPLILEQYAQDTSSASSRFIILFHSQTPARVLAENCRSIYWVERYAVAQNPNTPPDTLQTLVRDGNRVVRAAASANLQQRNPHNKSTNPDSQQELGAASRTGVATNSEFPTDIMLKLKEKFPEQLINDPVFSPLLLENPDFDLVAQIPLTNLQSFLKQEQVPIDFIERAERRCNSGRFSRQDQLVLEAIAQHPNTPVSVLKRLAERDWLGRYLVQNPNIPGSTLEKLAGHKNEEVRWYVAGHPNTPGSALERLAKDPDRTIPRVIRVAVAKNPNTPGSALELLAGDQTVYANIGRDIRKAVAENPNTPLSALEKLAQDKDYMIRRAVALHPKITESFLIQMKILPDEQTARNLWYAKQSTTSANILEQLAERGGDIVRLAIAKNPNTPGDIIFKLLRTGSLEIWRCIAQHPNTPASVLEEIMRREPSLHSLIAQHPNTPASVLEEMMRQPDTYVRNLAAKHPNAPKIKTQG